MVEYRSGLENLLAKKSASLSQTGTNPDVVIAERKGLSICQLSFFENQISDLKSLLKKHGISDIPSFSQIKSGKTISAARVEMEKIWLISDELPDALDASFYPLDLSSARNVIRISGPRAGDMMARLCAVDFNDNARNFFATAIHHVGVHIHKHSDVFDIYIPRSFGESITDYIIDISQQYHVQMA